MFTWVCVVCERRVRVNAIASVEVTGGGGLGADNHTTQFYGTETHYDYPINSPIIKANVLAVVCILTLMLYSDILMCSHE